MFRSLFKKKSIDMKLVPKKPLVLTHSYLIDTQTHKDYEVICFNDLDEMIRNIIDVDKIIYEKYSKLIIVISNEEIIKKATFILELKFKNLITYLDKLSISTDFYMPIKLNFYNGKDYSQKFKNLIDKLKVIQHSEKIRMLENKCFDKENIRGLYFLTPIELNLGGKIELLSYILEDKIN